LQGHGRGDLFVVTTIVTPTRLTREQKRLLEEFANIEERLNQGTARRFGSKVKDIFS
jgi:molecular chaperone DnaJ